MPVTSTISEKLIQAATDLRKAVDSLEFAEPVTHVYNPLDYAWEAHRLYLERFANSTKRIVFIGMNPGPWGMAQVGVPFGEIPSVRDWMKIEAFIGKPAKENPKRPIEGFACTRSEVSGRRLWGLMAERFGPAEKFFKEHIILNYCPLVFMEESGRNVTPDKLPASERTPLTEACDKHLREIINILNPEWCIGVGGFARKCFERVGTNGAKIGVILHPSPASPAANRDWAGTADRQLTELGIW
jgi:single-strand selective monofunctional uracil DNA glycosylase